MLDLFKDIIEIADVLNAIGIDFIEEGDELKALCPNPKHFENEPSWSINRNPDGEQFGNHHCFGCGFGGSLVKLVENVLELSGVEEAEEYIASLFGLSLDLTKDGMSDKVLDHILLKRLKKVDGRKLERVRSISLNEFPRIDKSDKYYQYLIGRGITPRQIRFYNLRKAVRGRYKDRVIFPLRNLSGEIVSFYARSIVDNTSQKFKGRYPKGKNTISNILYGWNRVDTDIPSAILSEGVFDYCKLDRMRYSLRRIGFGNPLAVMGGGIATAQILALKKFKELVVFRDGDAGGIKFSERVIDNLSHRCKIYVTNTPKGSDPDDLSDEQILPRKVP